MILAVELGDGSVGLAVEVAKVGLIFALLVASGDKVVPLIHVLQRFLCNCGCGAHLRSPRALRGGVSANVYHLRIAPCKQSR